MALPLKATLGEMRAELLSRLGMASQGAAAGNMVPTVNSYLQRSQQFLYRKYEDLELRIIEDINTAAGQTLYDWLDTMDPRQIIELRVLYSGVWHPMKEGIEFFHDTVADTRYFPRRYERRAQLEVWPEPDGVYTLRIEHYQRLGQFTQDGDRCTINEELLFEWTLGRLKRHYKHDDAKDYIDTASELLRQMQGSIHGNKRYLPGGDKRDDAHPMPTVV